MSAAIKESIIIDLFCRISYIGRTYVCIYIGAHNTQEGDEETMRPRILDICAAGETITKRYIVYCSWYTVVGSVCIIVVIIFYQMSNAHTHTHKQLYYYIHIKRKDNRRISDLQRAHWTLSTRGPKLTMESV